MDHPYMRAKNARLYKRLRRKSPEADNDDHTSPILVKETTTKNKSAATYKTQTERLLQRADTLEIDVGINIKATKLNPKAYIPTKSSAGAAGFDLTNIHKMTIGPFTLGVISTGIALEIPEGYYGLIAMRSGLARREKLIVLGGIIDCDYRGDVTVLVMNLQNSEVNIGIGERFAQIIVSKIHEGSTMEEVESLTQTKRGQKGFGSSVSK